MRNSPGTTSEALSCLHACCGEEQVSSYFPKNLCLWCDTEVKFNWMAFIDPHQDSRCSPSNPRACSFGLLWHVQEGPVI